jgi:hypothetical protein
MSATRCAAVSLTVVLSSSVNLGLLGTPLQAAKIQIQSSDVAVRGNNDSPPTAAAATTINVRTNASTMVRPIGVLTTGQTVDVRCQVVGEVVVDPSGSSAIWDQVNTGRYVSDVFIRWPYGRPPVPWCSFPTGAVPTKADSFVTWAASFAQPTQAMYGVPAAVTIAQAILESGWGRSRLSQDGNNFFGMKCFGGPGGEASGCTSYRTSECDDSACWATAAAFRMYPSVAASFADHAHSLASLPRYRRAFAYTADPDRFVAAIATAGYATSRTYARDVINLMRENNLYRFG